MKTKLASVATQGALKAAMRKTAKKPSKKKPKKSNALDDLRKCIVDKAKDAGFQAVKIQLISQSGKLIVRYQSNLTLGSNFTPEFKKLGKVICSCLKKHRVAAVKGFQMKAYKNLQSGGDGPMAAEPPAGGGPGALCTCDGSKPVFP